MADLEAPAHAAFSQRVTSPGGLKPTRAPIELPLTEDGILGTDAQSQLDLADKFLSGVGQPQSFANAARCYRIAGALAACDDARHLSRF